MPQRDDDPIASTQLFRAFVTGGDAEPASRRRSRAIALAAVVAVVVMAAVIVVLIAR
jgi:hypothetical protein